MVSRVKPGKPLDPLCPQGRRHEMGTLTAHFSVYCGNAECLAMPTPSSLEGSSLLIALNQSGVWMPSGSTGQAPA